MPFKKGKSGNPSGRPKRYVSIAEKFRKDPNAKLVMDKIIEVANTLGGPSEHHQAVSCAKIVADKIIPSLKAQDVKLDASVAVDMPKVIIKLRD
mgnify:CR=1 FL=1